MIAGPILPRTADSIRDLVLEDASRLESGLAVVRESLVLGDGARVDMLARDASGRAVLIFCVDGHEDRGLAPRVLGASQWWVENRELWRRHLPEVADSRGRDPRVVVLAFAFSCDGLERLLSLPITDLELLRVEAFEIDGTRYVGVVPVRRQAGDRTPDQVATGRFGRPLTARSGESARAEDASTVESSVDASPVGDLPPAILDGLDAPQKTGVRDLVHGVRRMEPSLFVDGDRFARRFFFEGQRLFSLHRERSAVRVQIDGSGQETLRQPGDVNRILDRVIRRFVAVLDQTGHAPARNRGFESGDLPAWESGEDPVDALGSSPSHGAGLGGDGDGEQPRGEVESEPVSPRPAIPTESAPAAGVAVASSTVGDSFTAGEPTTSPEARDRESLARTDLGPLLSDDPFEARSSRAEPAPIPVGDGLGGVVGNRRLREDTARVDAAWAEAAELASTTPGKPCVTVDTERSGPPEVAFETDRPEPAGRDPEAEATEPLGSAHQGSSLLGGVFDLPDHQADSDASDPTIRSVDPGLLDGLQAVAFGRIEDAELTDDELGAFFDLDQGDFELDPDEFEELESDLRDRRDLERNAARRRAEDVDDDEFFGLD